MHTPARSRTVPTTDTRQLGTTIMTIIDTINLTGDALDWAVAKAIRTTYDATTRYSTDWNIGGPLLESHGIGFHRNSVRVYANDEKRWEANRTVNLDDAPVLRHGYRAHGSTPLIAGLRVLVRSKLGATVDVPADLLNVA
ncbi:DUF2591 domain-containing protein, partial [Burkholderia gladioli]